MNQTRPNPRSGFLSLRGTQDTVRKTNFMALAEVERLALFTRQLGRKRSAQILDEIIELVCFSLRHTKIGRANRSTIEFAFAAQSSSEAIASLEALSRLIEQALQIDGLPLNLHVRFGLAPLPTGEVDDDALDNAECALAEAKLLRRRVVYAPDLSGRAGPVAAIDPVHILRELHNSLMQGRFEMYFQPKVSMRTSQIEGAEALIRWHHEDYANFTTTDLIAVAESTGAIRDLTLFGVDSVVEAQRKLTEAGHRIHIAVNLSATLLTDEPFIQLLCDKLLAAPAPIGIEVTETAILDDPERAMASLAFLHEAGIRIAIDDYGTGLSSLTYLREMPADELKIDRSFIGELTTSHRDPLIVRSTIDLAHALDLEVCAEGIEDGLTLALLSAMGCDMLQGYHLGQPMPLPIFMTHLEGWSGVEDKLGALPQLRTIGKQA